MRNSLVHDLGVTDDPKQTDARTVRLGKGPLDLDTIVYLERCGADQHPLKASPVIEEQDATYDVHLFGVYWALHRMLRVALNDRPTEIESALAGVVFPEFEELLDQPPPVRRRRGLREGAGAVVHDLTFSVGFAAAFFGALLRPLLPQTTLRGRSKVFVRCPRR